VLEGVAADFQCELLSFEVDHGTVSFVFDNDELNAEILRVLEENKCSMLLLCTSWFGAFAPVDVLGAV